MVQWFFWVYGGKERFCLPVSQYSPNSSLSCWVVQQKNGSIKSWSSPCQVTPRKWVLKLFLGGLGWDGRSQTGLVFKVRKWKLCFLMSCLSGCLCVWWSVKCSVTLTKWLSLCSCGFKWPSSQCHCFYLHPGHYEIGRQIWRPSINTVIAWRACVYHSCSPHTVKWSKRSNC